NSKTSKEEVLKALGGIKTPSAILFYPNSYDSKEAITTILDEYNVGKDKEEQITYTDTIATALSMIKTIMNSISIILIAFSAISLVVSSVMIGIITYTSVLERTKEIGVLRSIGARKKDISRVFNAEAIIVGFLAGTLGVLITYLLNPIISKILEGLMEASNVAQLYYVQAVILIIISIGLTFIAGLIPSRIAAKKDPVVALRTE
ncbi:MAG: FtsX-like permease family protein, partial [Candidatus Phytoplasma sp.]|nr:FtsX-like permease family protein [Phytoplasma sp.]